MDDGIILYSTGCPKCRILEKKLDEKGVEYRICSDVEHMMELGIMEVPVLRIKGELYSFAAAVSWVNQQEGASNEH